MRHNCKDALSLFHLHFYEERRCGFVFGHHRTLDLTVNWRSKFQINILR